MVQYAISTTLILLCTTAVCYRNDQEKSFRSKIVDVHAVTRKTQETKTLVNETERVLSVKKQMIVPAECCPSTIQGALFRSIPKVLIGLITSGKAERGKLLMTRNIIALADMPVSWLVGFYSGNKSDFSQISNLARNVNVNFTVFDGRSSSIVKCPFCPKLQFQIQFVNYTLNYDYVFLVDEDISFVDFPWCKFWAKHWLAKEPLIAQPLIRQDTQFTDFLVGASQWKYCNTSKYVVTDFIEIQVPVLDARFFEWLVPQVMHLVNIQINLKNDWGLDRIWCKAAAAYLEGIIRSKRTPCAIIFDEVDHMDARSIVKTKQYRDSKGALRLLS